jgi:GR25 family glycosyltransferase involved in LPS biosynthesis
VERVSGIVYTGFEDRKRNACMGNHMSHAYIMLLAKDLKLDAVTIFEDDVEFFPNAKENIELVLKELPDDWHMLYWGANVDVFHPKLISPHIAKLTGAFSTHAYIVKNSLFDKLIDLNLNVDVYHNDVAYASEIHPYYNCYLAVPMVAGQRESYSDIEGKVMKSNSIFIERFNRNVVK